MLGLHFRVGLVLEISFALSWITLSLHGAAEPLKLNHTRRPVTPPWLRQACRFGPKAPARALADLGPGSRLGPGPAQTWPGPDPRLWGDRGTTLESTLYHVTTGRGCQWGGPAGLWRPGRPGSLRGPPPAESAALASHLPRQPFLSEPGEGTKPAGRRMMVSLL